TCRVRVQLPARARPELQRNALRSSRRPAARGPLAGEPAGDRRAAAAERRQAALELVRPPLGRLLVPGDGADGPRRRAASRRGGYRPPGSVPPPDGGPLAEPPCPRPPAGG